MRKKATYWGVALSLALGATAVAAYSPTLNLFGAGISALADDATDDDATETSLGVPTSVTPANGSTFGGEKGLYEVTAAFAGTVTVNLEGAPATLKNAAGDVLMSVSPSSIIKVTTSSVKFTLPDNLQQNGNYTFNIPAGLFSIEADGQTVANEEIVLNYSGDFAAPTSVVPASGSTVIQDGGLASVTLYFQQDVTINRYVSSGGDDAKTTIFVKKDGETLQRIPLSDLNGFKYGDDMDNNNIKITFPEAIETPGEYTIEIPSGAVYVANKNEDSIGADKTNERITLTYTIEKPWHYSVFPAQGSQLRELKDFSVVFSDATAIELTSDYDLQDQAVLQYVAAGKESNVSMFNLKTSGNNTLQLEAIDPYTTPITAVATQWNQVFLPAGLLTLTIDGEKVPSPELKLGRYQVLAFPASDFSSPYFGVTEGIPANDLTEVNLHIEGTDVAFAGSNFTYIYLYPVINGNVATTAHANYQMAAANGEGNFTLTMRPATSNTSVLGHPELWESGQYIIRMPANAVSKTINGTTCKNISVDLGPIYIKGVSSAVPLTVTPADGTVVNTNLGLSSVSMAFGSAMVGVAGKNISIYREGETQPIATVAANGSTVTYGNSNKTVDFGFSTIKTPGTYRIVVPAGAFRQSASNLLESEEMTLTYVLPEPTPYVASPVENTICTANEDLNTVTITYTEVESITQTDPDTPVVLPLYNGQVSSVKTSYTTTIEGNKIILTAPEGFNHASSSNDLFFMIPGGIWQMKGKDGKTYQNLPETLVYKFAEFDRPQLSWDENVELTINDIRNGFTYYFPEDLAEQGYEISSVGTTAASCPKLFGNNYVPGGQTLTTSTANTYAQFFPILAEDKKSVKFVPITQAFKDEVAENADGKYTEAQQKALAAITTLYNTDGIVTGSYYLRLFNSPTAATGSSVAYSRWEDVTNEKTGKVENTYVYKFCRAPYNYTFNVKGLEAFPVQTDLKASYEALPDQIVLSSEEGDLGFFPALKPTFYLRPKVGGVWSTAKTLTAAVEDGKVIVTIPATIKSQLAKNFGEMCLTTVSTGSTIATGSLAITTDEGTATNEAGTFVFNVTGPVTNPDHTVAPVQGNLPVGEALSEITITYPEGFPVEVNEGTSASVYVTKEGAAAPVATIPAEDLKIEGNVLTITLPEPVTEDGIYTVTINRGMLLYGELKASSVEYNLTYHVTSLAKAVVSGVTPSNGENISTFTYLLMELKSPTDVAKAETVGDISFSFVNKLDPNAEPMTFPLYAYANNDGESLNITVDEATERDLKAKGMWPIAMPGEYTIVIPDNAIVLTTDDGTQYGVPGRTVNFELTPSVTASWSPKNGSMITELQTITVDIAGYPVIEKTADFKCTVSGAGKTIDNTVEIVNGQIQITLAEAQTAEGSYSISIPAKSLAIAKSASDVKQYAPALSYSIAISGAPSLTCTFPQDGAVIEFFCNITLKANYTPSANRAVTEPITVKRNGETVYTLTNRSSGVQYEFMGALGVIDLAFMGANKDYTPGTYTVELPEGVFLMGGVAPSPAKTFTFYVPEQAQYEMTPAPGSLVEHIETFDLYFPGATDIVFHPEAGADVPEYPQFVEILCTSTGYSSNVPRLVETTDEKEGNEAVIARMVQIEGDHVKLNFTPTDGAGEYVLQFPAGAFTMMQNGQSVASTYITYKFYISNIATPTVTPAPGVIAPDGLDGDLTITLGENELFSQFNNGTTYNLYRADESGIWNDKLPIVASWTFDFAAQGTAKDKPSVTLAPNQKNLVLDEGTYILRLKERTIIVVSEEYSDNLDGDIVTFDKKVCCSPFFYTYTVVNKPDVDLSYTLTPEAGANVASLGTVTITFDKAEQAVLNGPAAVLSNESGSEMVIYIGEANGNAVTLTTTENIAEGKWTLTVPEAAYLVDGVESPAIVAEYTVVKEQSAIAALFGENTPLNVFTVSGICVLRDATAEQVAELEAGLYIINGKKVYLRK